MPRPGTSSRRGYGSVHQAKRRAALRAHLDGDPCPLCGQPMFKEQGLDLDHETPIALGGSRNGPTRLTHRVCNRRAGQRLGQQAKTGREPLRTSRSW